MGEKEMKEEKEKKELIEKSIVSKDTEIKKQRKHYGDKMKKMRTKLDKAVADEAAIVNELANSEVARKELVTRMNLMERNIVEIRAKVSSEEMEEELKYWKDCYYNLKAAYEKDK